MRNLITKNKIRLRKNNELLNYGKIRKSEIRAKGKNNSVSVLERAELENVKIRLLGSNIKVLFADDCNIKDCEIIISGDNLSLFFDKNCIVKEKSKFAINGNKSGMFFGSKCEIVGCDISISDSGNISIAKDSLINYSNISNCCRVSKFPVNISIGAKCMFGRGTQLDTTDHHMLEYTDGTINLEKDIIIQNNVWIGEKSEIKPDEEIWTRIQKGVVIPKNCVICARSVVTKPLTQSNMVYGGNPAKAVGKKTIKRWVR